MGLDPQGIPNLVEEGETVYNDYVFSDRMKVPFFMYKELGLGGVMKKKGKEMSFADASKKLAQESEQRPNDPISKAGFDAQMQMLAEQQERQKQEMEAERAKETFEALSPEKQVAVMQRMQQEEALAQEAALQQEQQALAQEATVEQPIANIGAEGMKLNTKADITPTSVTLGLSNPFAIICVPISISISPF
jgi:hypothetical protein